MASEVIFRDQSIPDDYVVLNFNDLGSSLVTLFTLMVVSNCYVTEKIYINGTGNKYTRFFFSIFLFSCGTVMLNIIIAFVIDMYQCVDIVSKKESENESNMNKESAEFKDFIIPVYKIDEEEQKQNNTKVASTTDFSKVNEKILRNDVENIIDFDLSKDSYIQPKFIKNVSFGYPDQYASHSMHFEKSHSKPAEDSNKQSIHFDGSHSPKFGSRSLAFESIVNEEENIEFIAEEKEYIELENKCKINNAEEANKLNDLK